jgi:hypothetical protein
VIIVGFLGHAASGCDERKAMRHCATHAQQKEKGADHRAL